MFDAMELCPSETLPEIARGVMKQHRLPEVEDSVLCAKCESECCEALEKALLLARQEQGMRNLEAAVIAKEETAPALPAAPPTRKTGCFIATACYGSYNHSAVQEFRWFRDNRLNGTPWGRCLVDAYYKLSPPLAAFLQRRPVMATAIRFAILAPTLRLVRWFHREGTR